MLEPLPDGAFKIGDEVEIVSKGGCKGISDDLIGYKPWLASSHLCCHLGLGPCWEYNVEGERHCIPEAGLKKISPTPKANNVWGPVSLRVGDIVEMGGCRDWTVWEVRPPNVVLRRMTAVDADEFRPVPISKCTLLERKDRIRQDRA